MVDDVKDEVPSGAIALEHLTGPSRGRMTWLSGADLDISLGENRILRFEKAQPCA